MTLKGLTAKERKAAIADVHDLAFEVGKHEVRITTLESGMKELLDPEKGVFSQLAGIQATLKGSRWIQGTMTTMVTIILVLVGYLLVLHVHP